jgi:CRP-like cAMP-binding protein
VIGKRPCRARGERKCRAGRQCARVEGRAVVGSHCVRDRTTICPGHRLADLAFAPVGLRFLEQLSARLLETEAVVEDFAFKGVPARLAGALLRLSATAQDSRIRASHQELADMIAAYRETVTLALDEFQTRKVVRLGRRSIEILDESALEKLAAG